MFDVNDIRNGQTIAFDYARKTASNVRGRIGIVEKTTPTHVVVKEDVNGNVQYRSFHKSCVMNLIIG